MPDQITIAVYNKQIDAWSDMVKKETVDPALLRFIDRVASGGYVLDLGCGTAHASAFMRDRGLTTDPIDASVEMVNLANKRYNIGARLADFEDITFRDVYDGVWANFSLLHATSSEFTTVLTALHRALKNNGVLHLGMKIGTDSGRDRLGRFYTYYTEDELRSHLTNAGFLIEGAEVRDGSGLAGIVETWILITGVAK